MNFKKIIQKNQKKYEENKKNKLIFYLNDHIYLMGSPKNISIWYKDGFITSQCHKEEEFDKIKGILVCLSKLAGHTYEDIKKKMALRGCEDDDKVELFYLYDIAYDAFGLTEDDVKKMSESVIVVK